MKRFRLPALLVAVLATGFLAGTWVTWHASPRAPSATSARKVLYYACPMHPQYHADRAGDCPSCGMRLEPVYADAAPARGDAPVPANAIQIAADKQQVIGVRVGRVEKASLSRPIATIGRVAVDETRIYKLTTNVDGRVRDLSPVSSGSLVRKDDLLLRLTARDVLTAEQSFLYGLWAVERYQKEGTEGPDQMKIAEGQVKSGADALANLGMSARQIEELRRTRTPTPDIEVRSPVTGFVISRTVFPNQRYENGSELFRVADLSRVWVLADVFAEDARLVKPGMPARVTLSDPSATSLDGRVSEALPTFDSASRTFKVRIEVENRSYLLRPDMFVDVRFAIPLPPSLTVPADAIIDSGQRRIVFIDRGNGFYEPRTVETGWRVGDRVQVVRGLMESDAIVVSGNFLLDSEARMKAAAMGLNRATSRTDPVCGMEVDPAKAAAARRIITRGANTYYFCSDECQHRFEQDPARYGVPPGAAPVREVAIDETAQAADLPSGTDKHARGRRDAPDPERERTAQPKAAIDNQVPQAASAPSLAVPYAGARVNDGQYVPKNRRLRSPGRGGTPMRVAAPDEAMPATGVNEGGDQKAVDARETDPVCGMKVDRTLASGVGMSSTYGGTTYYFCSRECKDKFDKDPARYAKK